MIETLREKKIGLALGLGAAAVVVLVSELAWHVHNADYIQGLFPALAAGLTAACLVLMYRTARFINFTQVALGGIAAQLFYELQTRNYLPYPFAIATAILGGAAVAVLIGVAMSLLFFRHPRLVLTVVTIVLLGVMSQVQGTINDAFSPEGEIRTIKTIFGPYPNHPWTIDLIPFRVAHLTGLVLLLAAAIGLAVFFRRTRMGTAIRASAENADRASLLGINVKLLQVTVWFIVGLVSSVALLAQVASGIASYNVGATTDTRLLLLPFAAAVVARLHSMPVAFFTAFGLEMTRKFIFTGTSEAILPDVALFAIIIAGLLLQRKKLMARAEEVSSWRGVKEVRPMPREMLTVRGIARTRQVLLLLVAALVLAMPWMTSLRVTGSLTQVWIYGLVALSLVILTGWSGQISLGQFSFVMAGAFIAGILTSKASFPFPVALPVAGLVGAAFAFVVGIPALRIRGLFLALTTFALAAVLPFFVFENRFLGRYVPKEGLGRPRLFFLDFGETRSWYYLTMVIFVVFVLAVQALRKSRGGRVLIALRDNEDGVQAFGVDVVRTRLIAFALAGFVAAFAGAILVHNDLGMTRQTFNFDASITVFIFTVLGGISSPIGAFLGTLFYIGGGVLFPGIRALLTGLAGLTVLFFIPGGLSQVLFGTRDAILRVVAMRRHIVVPSLFADYSPEAWEKRLAPLSPAVQSQGLGTFKPDQRYRLPSKIFGRTAV